MTFNQSEKEVQDLRERTREALRERKKQGIILGMRKGATFETEKIKGNENPDRKTFSQL